MNWLLASAAALAFVVGLAHLVLGERLIFRRMRQSGFVPTNGGRVIGEGHVRIIWASWHVLTVFGWCIAAVLLWLSLVPRAESFVFITNAVIVSMLFGSAFVLIGTMAKHPGWAGLLGVAALTWFAAV